MQATAVVAVVAGRLSELTARQLTVALAAQAKRRRLRERHPAVHMLPGRTHSQAVAVAVLMQAPAALAVPVVEVLVVAASRERTAQRTRVLEVAALVAQAPTLAATVVPD